MIDALNCQEGCLEGTASEVGRFEEDEIIGSIMDIRKNRQCKIAEVG